MKKKIICIQLSVVMILATFTFLSKLLIPKYVTNVPEGSLIEEFYREKVHDDEVVFVGDCECYENISPITMYKKYGITSYIRGSAQQLIWQSYYLMEDTLRYETPDVFVFNVLSMKYGEPQSEAYNRLNLDGMRWSKSKYKAIKASMTSKESMIDYIFPLLRYHQRWNQLTDEDFTYLFKKKPQLAHNGFLMRADERGINPDDIPKPEPLLDYTFSETCYYYLDKMVKLCKENGVELVLMKAPSLYPAWYDQWDQQIKDYAEKNNIYYINFLEKTEEIGLDYNHDTYDQGLHLNLSGAAKMAKYFGKILKEKYGLYDGREDPEVAANWAGKVKAYDEEKKAQYAELEKYGYLKSWGAKKPEETDD